MTPFKFTVKNGTEYFHYKISDLRLFVEAAKDSGAAGLLLVARDSEYSHYRVSGTFDKPRPVKRMKDLLIFHMKPMAIFGPTPTAEQICTPPKSFEELFPHAGWFVPDGKGNIIKL